MDDLTIIAIGQAMIDNDWRLQDLADNFDIPRSSVYYYLIYRLIYLDFNLHRKCVQAMERHKHNHLKRKKS